MLRRAAARTFASAASAATPNPYAHVKTVAVIGGGVAGLNAARALAASGFKVTVFEAAPEVGGVWRSNYAGFGLQVPRNLYEFLDFPMADVPSPWAFPTGAQVQAYIRAFAAKFVEGKAELRTGTAGEGLAPRACGARGWAVTHRAGGAPAATTTPFDFAVVASGMYSRPFLPPAARAPPAATAVLHSTAFTDAALAKGKHVAVLGGAKSALDCAVAAADAGAASVTLISRAAHWGTPRKIAGLIPFQFVFLSRFGQGLVSWYKGALPGAPAAVGAAHAALAPIMGPVFALVEALFAYQLQLRGARAPKLDVVADFYGFAQVLDAAFQERVEKGAVKVVCGEAEAAEALRARGLVAAGGATGCTCTATPCPWACPTLPLWARRWPPSATWPRTGCRASGWRACCGGATRCRPRAPWRRRWRRRRPGRGAGCPPRAAARRSCCCTRRTSMMRCCGTWACRTGASPSSGRSCLRPTGPATTTGLWGRSEGGSRGKRGVGGRPG